MAIKNAYYVQKSEERWTLFMETEILNGYIIIPLVRNVEILLGLKENLNAESVKEIPFLKDKVIIMPVLDAQAVQDLRINQTSWNNKIREFILFINDAGALIREVTNSQMKMNKMVLLNNNSEFGNFVNYFDSVVASVQKSDRDLFKIEEPSKILSNEVVGQNVVNDAPVGMAAYPQDDIYQMTDEMQQSQSKGMVRTRKKEPGFVSYVLLGVLVAVMTLILLYMLL